MPKPQSQDQKSPPAAWSHSAPSNPSVSAGRAASTPGATAPLLGPGEPPPFEIVESSPRAAANRRVIICCDHASNRFPASLGQLGIPDRYLKDHITWDIGAAAVTRILRERFDADAILANYSRLVVDLNRRPSDRSAMPAISDGVLIPGNLNLSAEAVAQRFDTLHAPYHAAIEDLIARRSGAVSGDSNVVAGRVAGAGDEAKRVPVFIGVHSFTPWFHRTERPWHIGVLWDRDPRLAVPMLAALRALREFVIGDNEPYSGRHTADYSIDTHAEVRGMAHVGIEIRQDLIGNASAQARIAGVVGDALEAILADDALFEPLSPVNPIT